MTEINTAMYNNTPWAGMGHYVGKVDKDGVTSEEAIVAAGLDWKVKTENIFFNPDETKYGRPVFQIPNKKVIFREDDHTALGIVGDRYMPVQNHEAFKMMDSLVDDGLMKYHTAGTLRGGKSVWMLGKIGDMTVVPEDHVDKYLLLYNTHDGSSTLRCFFTTIRVACVNVVNAALRQSNGSGVTIRHSGDVLYKMDDAKTILGIANTQFSEYEQFIKQLSKTKMTKNQMEELAKHLFPDPVKELKRNAEKHIERRNLVLDLFENGKGQDIKNVGGTAWAGYNAITEYANFHSPGRGKNSQERRFESMITGNNNRIMQKANDYFLKLAA